jgi:hypothetical protein
MSLSTRLLALLLVVLLFGAPLAWIFRGPSVVIVDGDGPPPVGISFKHGDRERPLWRLTGHIWFGWAEREGNFLIVCPGPGGTLARREFGYVTTVMPDTTHVAACPGARQAAAPGSISKPAPWA